MPSTAPRGSFGNISIPTLSRDVGYMAIESAQEKRLVSLSDDCIYRLFQSKSQSPNPTAYCGGVRVPLHFCSFPTDEI